MTSRGGPLGCMGRGRQLELPPRRASVRACECVRPDRKCEWLSSAALPLHVPCGIQRSSPWNCNPLKRRCQNPLPPLCKPLYDVYSAIRACSVQKAEARRAILRSRRVRVSSRVMSPSTLKGPIGLGSLGLVVALEWVRIGMILDGRASVETERVDLFSGHVTIRGPRKCGRKISRFV